MLRNFLKYDAKTSKTRNWDIFPGDNEKLEWATERLLELFISQYKAEKKQISYQTKNELSELTHMLVYCCEREKKAPLFLQRPDIIYQIFWYHLRREFNRVDQKGYNLNKHIQWTLNTPFDANPENQHFFEALVDICTEVYSGEKEKVRKEWHEFWELLCSSRHCVEFALEDLLTYRRLFSSALLDENNKSGLDVLIRERLYSNERWLFRNLYKSAVNIERQKYGQAYEANEHKTLNNCVEEYKRYFTTPQDHRDVLRKYELCTEYSEKFGWNYVRRKVTDGEINTLLQKFKFSAEKKDEVSKFLRSAMKSFTPLYESESAETDIQRVLVEWLLIKVLEERSWRKLLGLICKVLSEDEKNAV